MAPPRTLRGAGPVYTGERKKAAKFARLGIIWPPMAVRLRCKAPQSPQTAPPPQSDLDRQAMTGPAKEPRPKPIGKADDDEPVPPPPSDDELYEAGDIATPERDRDDEQRD
jgi:hypothetical protein